MSIALNTFLKPLNNILESNDVSEVCINQPKEVWVEKEGRFSRLEMPELTKERLRQIAQLVAEYNQKSISEVSPLLSASLPSKERVQFVLPPACDSSQVICSIRKPSIHDMNLEEWEITGAFNYVGLSRSNRVNELNERLQRLKSRGQWRELIQTSIKEKLNILISGATSTAKTTFLNSCLKEIPVHERLVTVEDVREVKSILPNTVHLVANADEEIGLSVSMLELLKASFRLRPDRIFLSELRSKEAYPYLRACISGHSGSLTTLHADSIENAKEQLCFMLSESPELKGQDEERLRGLIKKSVQLFIQMKRFDDGTRRVDDIELSELN